ncbi:MAG TPA: response regulator transcription factor [Terriglobales bacterium]|nr:response regulator transcription factor [Terriglobales bacterium]
MVNKRVRQLVEAIQAETDPGRMAALAAALGVALDEAKEAGKSSISNVPPSKNDIANEIPIRNSTESVRVLVADDHEVVRKVLCDVLSSYPAYDVVCESRTANHAISKAKELQPDVVILDISLPDMNGIDVIRRIKEVAPSTEILLCSQHEIEDMVKAGFAAGARGYLLKSEAIKELIPAISAVANGEQYISPGILFSNS